MPQHRKPTRRELVSDFYTANGSALTGNKDDWETPRDLFEQLAAMPGGNQATASTRL
ncbi:hypothetical protein [Bifidobacterium pseudolongum]|uniref:hypothetical protein n=1 Tax=Bifidobacterium pseudolongum TaxID=1694 RepID=UPI0013ECB189|nr:hypothetical protein [Bifidobacterium pseudolongum]MCH4841714.1 hypothetical protein [Bifidobacterium pseudolongum]MCH4852040.1 hypothetical protein [Bifidobacterium pseudolongum]MCH4860945.1 hypothetical protein [Bifidobacterium pseudolongum]MCH4862718.1 hypothetical protein [Bifidobacterium pseudolongum]